MKNTMFRLMVVGLLVSSSITFTMDPAHEKLGDVEAGFFKAVVDKDGVAATPERFTGVGGKDIDDVVIPQSSAMWRFATKFAFPVAVIAGGVYAAKEYRGEVRGAGLVAALCGASSLMRNSWNRLHGYVDCTLTTKQLEAIERKEADFRKEFIALEECAGKFEMMLGAVLNELLPGAGRKAEFRDFTDFDTKSHLERTPEERIRYDIMIAMLKAQGSPLVAAQFANQLPSVREELLCDREE